MADHSSLDISSTDIARQRSRPVDKTPEPEDAACHQSDEIAEEKPADVPPDGGYGWVCVACSACINANTWGVNSTYAVFLSYYLSHDIFTNSSHLVYAFTGGLSMSCALLIAPLVTHLVHLYGNRFVLNIGLFLQTGAFIGASFATQQWHIFLSQGVCFGWGMGFLFIGSVGITPQWFLRRRSVANAIAAAGSGIGGLTYSLATGAMLPKIGLGWSFRVLGLCTFVINAIAANLLRDRNKATGSQYRAFHLPLFKLPEFLLLQAWGALSLLGYVVVLFSLPNYALSIGLTAKQGSIVGAVLNLGQALGRPIVGLMSDRWGRINIAFICTVVCSVLCFALWIPTQSMGLLTFFALIVGTVAGTYWTTVVPVCAEVIGLQELPSGLSLTWVLMVPPTTVSEPIAVLLKDDSRGGSAYLYAQIFAGVGYLLGAGCLWIVRGWKMGENEIAEKKRVVAEAETAGRGMKVGGESAVHVEKKVGEGEESNVTAAQDRGSGSAVSNPAASAVDERLWSPALLTRRMITWSRV
ncbi:hypothetical protein AJ80_06759 [Polytolypa hystricis UAMH7299]|uniref:Major facilitator superfamily (MFS) profile domain-containing protein n=1 Tax=Polytolypa hystricis (strain UAMH7299) TaxID=1447883 RepID=A0A2B7XTQ8_POLH7|nr:hypothetical protein AJ80_06759 [Polytolypa hystricis UAMH7299]